MTRRWATSRRRLVAWTKADPPGSEVAEVDISADQLVARGTAIGSDPEPYRLDYDLETVSGFRTTRVRVAVAAQDWRRGLDLTRDPDGTWQATTWVDGETTLPEPGGDTRELAAALDPDLGLSPLFNTMPVLRHDLLTGERRSVEFTMAWISVPDLVLHAAPQRYTHLAAADGRRPASVEFASTGPGEDFRAEIAFDADGLVIDYPRLATRLRGTQIDTG